MPVHAAAGTHVNRQKLPLMRMWCNAWVHAGGSSRQHGTCSQRRLHMPMMLAKRQWRQNILQQHPVSAADLAGMAAEVAATAAEMPAELELLREGGIPGDAVAQCIQRASPYSGAGPSGLRYSHLQDALRTTWGKDQLSATLVRWIELVMRDAGRIPDLFWQLHAAARLTPLTERQADGTCKLRPIACGEVLQRLCTSVYVGERKGFLAELLQADGQYGVAVPAGAEKAALAGKLAYELGHWQLNIDLRNAFNAVRVTAAAKWVAAQLPDLLGYFIATYMRNRPNLLFGHADGSVKTIPSQRGVKQGDPLGPVLFCGAIADCLKRFNKEAIEQRSRRRIGAYIDDANVRIGGIRCRCRHARSGEA